MSMASTPLAVTMATVTCSWRESMCTTMKLLVRVWMSVLLSILWQRKQPTSMQTRKWGFLHTHFSKKHFIIPEDLCMLCVSIFFFLLCLNAGISAMNSFATSMSFLKPTQVSSCPHRQQICTSGHPSGPGAGHHGLSEVGTIRPDLQARQLCVRYVVMLYESWPDDSVPTQKPWALQFCVQHPAEPVSHRPQVLA